MDNRTNTTEDFQSTPEHLAGHVGGGGSTIARDTDVTATPGALRQTILDAEHDENLTGGTQWRTDTSRQAGASAGALERTQHAGGAVSQRPVLLALVGVAIAIGLAMFTRSRSNAP